MTPAHIAVLLAQLDTTGQGLADLVNAYDPHLRLDRNAVSRHKRGAQVPALRAELAYAALWLNVGYPAVIDGRSGILTTNHSASSYGLPVAVIDGQAYGSGEVTRLDLGDAPPSIVEAVERAGYGVG